LNNASTSNPQQIPAKKQVLSSFPSADRGQNEFQVKPKEQQLSSKQLSENSPSLSGQQGSYKSTQVLANGNSGDVHPGERLAKRIARCGLCSRRTAETWIAQGVVMVDGRVVRKSMSVTPQNVITINHQELNAERPKIFLYHKARQTLVQHNPDPGGRKTIFEKIKNQNFDIPDHIVSVGRLDYNSEGLLILTNDGVLARYLEHPSSQMERKYRVRVYGQVNEQKLARLITGVTINGIRYGSVKVTVDKRGPNSWLTLSLYEGKNREIHRIMEWMDLTVTRLIRVQYGPFQLEKLAKGKLYQATIPKELKAHCDSGWNWAKIKI